MSSPTGKKKADLKLVMLGAASVGKTTLIHRYIEGQFKDEISTIGASFSLKQWGPYNIAIWDTAGEERFAGLSSFYCRGAGAAILAFDLTDEDTFLALRSRFVPLLQAANSGVLCAIVGTKSDLLGSEDHMRKVSRNEAEALTRELNKSHKVPNKLPYFETSSVSGDNVDTLFNSVFEFCLPLDGYVSPKVQRSASTVDLDKGNDPKGGDGGGGCKC